MAIFTKLHRHRWRPVYCHRQAQRLRRRVRGRGGWRSVLGSEGFVLGFEGGRERFVFGGGKGLCAAYLREGGWAEEGFKGGGGGGWRFAGSGGASSPNRGDGRDGGALAAVAHSRQRSNLVIPLSRDLLSWWRLRRSDCPVMLQGESYSAGCICRGYRDGLLGLGSCWHLRADKINLKSLDAQLLLFWMIFFHFLDAQFGCPTSFISTSFIYFIVDDFFSFFCLTGWCGVASGEQRYCSPWNYF
ncbi:hypothetical protein LR48_Vigan07g144700 [Vigna angularis]|uniref:Uncharacterized protein n=1 Tax=Phaseolus angularis TaxID=3914 RepID=A0A0L9UY84_PHAAN|nr:uncharacterized protein HKW66_Vig0125100 [Vigna angularis]KOM47743.1 hypothetical protein LR48_Vigan07g144700 [Vigna angularis]